MTATHQSTSTIGSESSNAIPMGFKVTRDMRGSLEAETVIDMGADDRVLVIKTYKTSGGLVTTNTVNTKQENGFLVWEMFGDYSSRIVYKGARCTEKTIRDLHTLALNAAPARLIEAAAHYAAKAAKVAA